MSAGPAPRSGSRMVLSEINVTPLVDVMLVLLIIFMVTAPMMQQGLDVELPETSNSGVETTDEPFVLVIKKNGGLFAGSTELKMDALAEKLKAIFSTRKNKQVYIQADKQVDYGTVAEAMGEIRAAGIYQIGMITMPKSGRK
ncbi:MAG: protein TolR [Bdellovibrionales bacterium]